MAITIIEIPKVILNLSLVSGGDLPDATEYFFIGWMGQGAGYYGGAWGEASDQVSITTTAPNQSIRIDWEYWHDSVLYTGVGVYSDMLTLLPESHTGSGAHRDSVLIKWDYYTMLDGGSVPYKWCNLNDPAISDEFQDGNGHRRWMQSYAGNGIRADFGTFNTTTMSVVDQGPYNHGQVAWRYDIFDVHTPFPMEKSDLVIIVTGTGNSEFHLINALETADAAFQDRFHLSNSNDYTANNVWNILLKGTIIGDRVTADLTLNRITLTTLSATMILLVQTTYNDCTLANNRLTVNFWINLYGTFNNTVFHHNGNALILDNIAGADGFVPWCVSGTTNYGAIDGLYLKDLPQHQWRYFTDTMPITDTTLVNTFLTATAYSQTHDFTGVNAITWTNVKFLNEGLQSRDINFTYSYIGPGETGYDEINAYNLFSDRPDGRIRCNFTSMEGGDGTSCIINAFQAMNFTIKDKDGVEIVGAIVSVMDADGEPYSDVTDINGEAGFFVKTYSVEYNILDPDGYGFASETIDLNPLTLSISADGYQVYVAVLTVTAETNMEIALIENIVDPSADGLTNAYETEAMRHLFLNEPILNIGDAGGLLPSVDPGYFYMALLTASPGEAGSIANEATFGGYARVPVPRTAAGWTEFLGTVRNLNQVNFALSLSGSETITHYAVMKELTGSEMVAYGALDDPTLIVPTWQLQFAPSQMEFNID